MPQHPQNFVCDPAGLTLTHMKKIALSLPSLYLYFWGLPLCSVNVVIPQQSTNQNDFQYFSDDDYGDKNAAPPTHFSIFLFVKFWIIFACTNNAKGKILSVNEKWTWMTSGFTMNALPQLFLHCLLVVIFSTIIYLQCNHKRKTSKLPWFAVSCISVYNIT